jgi:carboxypeptidase Q
MKIKSATIIFLAITFSFFSSAQNSETERLVAAMLGHTQIQDDLHELCDKIGGRVTGTESNEKAIEWSLRKFKESGVEARKEAFQMPSLWDEKNCTAKITGTSSFSPRVVSRAFSIGTNTSGLEAELISVGYGTEDDFKKAGDKIKDKFVLVTTDELTELGGLFKEYNDAHEIEGRAMAAQVKGVVYMSSRPKKLLFRHLASRGHNNTLPLVVMARDDASRCIRILDKGGKLNINLNIELTTGGSYTSYNVIGEIKGSEKPDEIVLIGAHLDSWGMGTGANDNGCNVSLVIDIARQMTLSGIIPKRTIRFALWNGEEQCICGSYAYTQQHENELDKHIVIASIDIGSGRITGFFTGYNPELDIETTKALESVASLAPYDDETPIVEDIPADTEREFDKQRPQSRFFQNVDAPIVGTDNYDFMMQGVPNLVGIQEGANYCSDYHSESDTYDKVNLQNLKINSAIVASTILHFANLENVILKRKNRNEVQKMIEETKLDVPMKAFEYWQGWLDGTRGRKP